MRAAYEIMDAGQADYPPQYTTAAIQEDYVAMYDYPK